MMTFEFYLQPSLLHRYEVLPAFINIQSMSATHHSLYCISCDA